ncbi:hypothetical protein KC318_g7188 [Hortaea werneckii]|nr:hypothetical protein KC334_g2046 [Hortaea werneckii]KAI7014335.1 hypothetical protein KC355_g4723 [Hortaea werneckii]KAI7202425.1 hypothetical protein KC324_g1730 [Hortaea werneckii]KAI7591613.1 hypothetical protein KC316_g2768 [Hortaea werneckii]KAI7665319.1 hypothetical protein KC318_g7188 [Hortaea werneckii]
MPDTNQKDEQSRSTPSPTRSTGNDTVPVKEHDKVVKENQELQTQHNSLRRKFSKLEAENDEQKAKIRKLNDGSKLLSTENGEMQERINELQLKRHNEQKLREEKELEMKGLVRDLVYYRNQVLATNTVANQISDAEFQRKMADAFREAEQLAVLFLCSGKLDLKKLSRAGKKLLETYVLDTNTTDDPVMVVVSLISTILKDMSHPKFHFGQPKSASLEAAKEFVELLDEDHDPADRKAWLQATRKLMQQTDQQAIHDSEQAMVDAAVDQVFSLLGNAISTERKTVEPRLRRLFTPTFALFRELHLAKADFHIEMVPVMQGGQSTKFDPDEMLAVSTSKEDSELKGHAVEISAFPLIYKFGDGMGDHMDEATIIGKAKVVACKTKPSKAKQDVKVKVEE